MANKQVSLGIELHIYDKVYYIRDKRAFRADGTEYPKDQVFVCQHCTNSPPFVGLSAKDFAAHMVDKHPDQAKAQVAEADKTEADAKGPKKGPKKG